MELGDRMSFGRQAKGLAALVVIALAVAGCGRKAPLDTPYQAAVEERRQAIEDEEAVIPPEPKPPVEDKPFVLDSLI
jgi:predicted small lipoprotein YifL